MPRKRKTKKKKVESASKLPAGFWSQVFAICLIAFSILLIVAWFGVGGPVLNWTQDNLLQFVGYTVYILPVIFTFIGIEIFRSENNKLSFLVKLGGILLVMWFSGLFGLPDSITGHGGWLGNSLNSVMIQLVNAPVAGFIYVLFIFVTLMMVGRVSPQALLAKIWHLLQTEKLDGDNAEVMESAKAAGKKSLSDFKMTAGVEMLSSKDKGDSDIKQNSNKAEKAESESALISIADPDWKSPSLDLLEKKQAPVDPGDVKENARIIKDTLGEFSIDVTMEGANIGPKVTQYTLMPPSGVKLSRIAALETNIALNLAAQSIRIEAPIPGKRAVGIEVPNKRAAEVRLRGVLETDEWSKSHEPLSFAVGRNISGAPIVGELNKMPHLLIAGQTNSGKSVMINTLLCSLLYRNSPAQMKIILVDPKQVEMARYKDIPHLLTPIITTPEKTVSALKWAVDEMEKRYKLLAEVGELNIEDYNKSISGSKAKVAVKDENGFEQEQNDGAMPYIVVIIDEMADLMMVAQRDVESLIVRLAQKARAVGIHLVLATQSPRADVITGLIKANVPAKIAFTVGNQIESRIIMDSVGAEKLLGQGDMLFKTATMSKPIRVQGAWVMNSEVKKIADYLRMQSPPQYNDEIINQPVNLSGKGGVAMDLSANKDDPVYQRAVEFAVQNGHVSASLLQRRLSIGYAKAARYIDVMEDQGIVGPSTGNSKPRDVLVSSLDDAGE